MKRVLPGLGIAWVLSVVAVAGVLAVRGSEAHGAGGFEYRAESAGAAVLAAAYDSPAVQIPTIDLRAHDFTRDGLAQLDGEWAMFWNTLVSPEQFQSAVDAHGRSGSPRIPESAPFSMPGTWNTYERNGRRLGGRGHASFAVQVLLPPGVGRGALRIPPASTAYRLWVNGEEVAASGDPGEAPDTTTPGRVVRSPVLDMDSTHLLLLMHVANFDHRVGGMWRPIWIGSADEITAYDIIDISYDLLLLGICLAFAAYNLLIYLASSRRSVAPLLFALFFLSVGVRVPTLGAVLATRALSGFPWHALIFIEYMTGHLIVALFCTALQLSYPGILGSAFRMTVIGLMSAFSIFLVVAGVTRYSVIINVFVAVVVGLLGYLVVRLAWVRTRRYRNHDRHTGYSQVRHGLLAALVVLGIVVSEWAHFSELILSRDATPLGFLLGVLSAPPVARAPTHLVLTAVTLLVVLTAASLLMYKVSDGLFGAAAREAAGREAATHGATTHDAAPRQAEDRQTAGPGVAPPDRAEPATSTGTPPPVVSDAGTAAAGNEFFGARYHLTRRELEIAAHVAEGLSNKEIAAVLSISQATVRTHIYRIFKKTAAQNRTELSKAYFSAPSTTP